MFFQKETGQVFWLNTGTGEIGQVADSMEDFRALLSGEAVENWFLPGLVEQLHAARKIPGEGCCYSYVILPVFAQGKYEVSNLNPVPAKEHFRITGDIHQKIRALPDGANVEVKVVP